MRNNRRHYPPELRDALRRSTGFLMESGVSLSTIRRLKRGGVKSPSPFVFDRLIMVNMEYWHDRLVKGGVTPDYAEVLMREATPVQLRFEIKQRREIARTIARNKDDGMNHPVAFVLEGMARSYRVNVNDWVRYTKELYNEIPEVEYDTRAVKGVRAMTANQRKRYYKKRRKSYD